jgi:hypothetical protein
MARQSKDGPGAYDLMASPPNEARTMSNEFRTG